MDSRQLIIKADEIARNEGFTQAKWSAKAGHAKSGQTVSRIVNKGDCRISTFLRLLEAIDCKLEIVRRDDANDTTHRL